MSLSGVIGNNLIIVNLCVEKHPLIGCYDNTIKRTGVELLLDGSTGVFQPAYLCAHHCCIVIGSDRGMV